MKIIKCENTTKRNGVDHRCGRFIAKFINEQQVHIKCPSCPAYTIVRVVGGELMIVHVDKEGEEQICNKKTMKK